MVDVSKTIDTVRVWRNRAALASNTEYFTSNRPGCKLIAGPQSKTPLKFRGRFFKPANWLFDVES